ncbi:GDSL-type esterase/lipase family protein [Streptomyces sp. NPDC003077]|uniref:GDSL-type esterase/lipase family protein n=1 Tax=Streptomyces sp. NPDC003077 TaxID=3154443 RepID=UPI0033BCE3C2
MTERWVAGFRSAVISPYERIRRTEPYAFRDQTVRQVLRVAGGGERIRVRLSNRYGRCPLTVADARVAVRKTADEIVTESSTGVRFDGSVRLTIPVGEEVVSDPVALAVRAGTELVLSLYLPEKTGPATFSHMPVEAAYVAQGNRAGAAALPGARPVRARFYVTGVDVLADEGTGVAVVFGDAWLEGAGTVAGVNRRSVDALNRGLGHGWVVNQGIAGNRLLTDEIGEHALARFERDVLSVPGARHVLAHFGVNDLGLPGMVGLPPATADELISGFTELAHRAHDAGLTIHAATIGPFAGAVYPGHSTPEGLAARRQVNEWIRTCGVFDAVLDVARAVEDPARADYLHPAFDSGDGMHLNDAGARVVAATVGAATVGAGAVDAGAVLRF